MTPQVWRKIEELYHAALDREPAERGDFLEQACQGDRELQRQVESLLARNSQENVLDRPAWQAAPPKTLLREGEQLGVYRVQARLGAGGMGEVFCAVDTRLDRKVAIKVCAETFSARFDREARALAALSHPRICTLFDVGPDYLVMELLDGETLAARIERGLLPVDEVARIGAQIADALTEAHAAGIVHRDLKPGNVMLTRHGVKVLDFGLAKVGAAPEQTLTQSNAVMGTPAFMAPEQAAGQEADSRSDLFALGLVLYQMAAGKLPFPGASLGALLSSGESAEVPPPSRARTGLPAGLDALIARLLDKEPAGRPQQAAAVRDELLTLAKPSRKINRRALAAAGLVAVLLAAGAAWRAARPTAATTPNLGPVSRVKLLTSYPGNEWAPALSPDGNQVAFSWDGGKRGESSIYVTLVGGDTPLKVTHREAGDDQGEDLHPQWSPDGSQIAFLRRYDPMRGEIAWVSALGGPEHKLQPVRWTSSMGTLAWTPNGKRIVYSSADEQNRLRLFVFSLETGLSEELPLKRADGSDASPCLSPNGEWLAFVRFFGPNEGTLMAQRLGAQMKPEGELVAVPSGGVDLITCNWSPDSKRLVFGEGPRIVESEVGGTPRQVYAANGDFHMASIVWREGHARAVAYGRVVDRDIWALPLQAGTHAGAGPPARRVSSTAGENFPRFSPDGRYIAFISDRGGNKELWVANANGENQRQISHLGGNPAGHARWSPDSRRITFSSWVSDKPGAKPKTQLYVVELNAGVPKRVAPGCCPSWSRDGLYIYGNDLTPGRARISRARVADGAVQTLFVGDIAMETPDGKRLLYSKINEFGIFSRSLEGDPAKNPEERIVDDYTPPGGGYDPVRDGFFYTGMTSQGKIRAFRFFDYARGRARDIAPGPMSPASGGGLSVSPDQRELLFTATATDSGDDIMLIEF